MTKPKNELATIAVERLRSGGDAATATAKLQTRDGATPERAAEAVEVAGATLRREALTADLTSLLLEEAGEPRGSAAWLSWIVEQGQPEETARQIFEEAGRRAYQRALARKGA